MRVNFTPSSSSQIPSYPYSPLFSVTSVASLFLEARVFAVDVPARADQGVHSEYLAVQPRSSRARAEEAVSLAGSPLRRPTILAGMGRPVMRRVASTSWDGESRLATQVHDEALVLFHR
jgi:hypothetical protein